MRHMKKTHVVEMIEKCFTEEHLKISELYINQRVWPKLYDKKILKDEWPGLEYVRRDIMNINDICFDRDKLDDDTINVNADHRVPKITFGYQSSGRAHGRGDNTAKLWQNLDKRGYELSHIPVSVCQLPDGKTHIMDGRTRLEHLIERGFTNIIVDVYKSNNIGTFEDWQTYANPPPEVRSPQKTEDLIRRGADKIRNGTLNPNNDIEIYKWIEKISGGAYSHKTVGKIVSGMIESSGGTSSSKSYTETAAKQFLNMYGYHDNTKENGIYYLIISGESKASSVIAAAKYMGKLSVEGKKVKELRLVINTGTLKGSDPSISWKKCVDDFRDEFENNLNIIKTYFFGSGDIDTRIKLYGVLPSVISLSQEYPMDRMVIFDASELKYKRFHQIDINRGMSAAVGVEEIEEEEY